MQAHRLKNRKAKSYLSLDALAAPRRVLLTGNTPLRNAALVFPDYHPTLLAGTPLQNELSEYYALVSFASPGLLGAEPFFAREFAKPIKARYTETAIVCDRDQLYGGCNRRIRVRGMRNDVAGRRLHRNAARIPDQAIGRHGQGLRSCSLVTTPSKAGIAKEASAAERALADAKQRQLSQRCLGMMLRPKPVALVLALTLALTL